jgi:hypothetical protein
MLVHDRIGRSLSKIVIIIVKIYVLCKFFNYFLFLRKIA